MTRTLPDSALPDETLQGAAPHGAARPGTPRGGALPGDAPEQRQENDVLDHVRTFAPLLTCLEREAPRLERWARLLVERLTAGRRLLVAGNGGSAAAAQHLTGELVGRFDRDRRPFSAIALSAETSSLTAIGNDYGFAEVFARQVRGHGRPGDILLALSTSGRSRDLVRAVQAARQHGLVSWAMTGASPNRLQLICDDGLCLPGPAAHVQEAQLIAIHALCRAFDARLTAQDESRPAAQQRVAGGCPGGPAGRQARAEHGQREGTQKKGVRT